MFGRNPSAWLVASALVLPVPLVAQGTSAWSTCKADSLSTWNCAHYYSGTVSIASDLRGTDLHETFSAVATITSGRAVCRIKGSEVGEFEGPGMIAVEHKATRMVGGGYEISVWCPEAEGERPTRRDAPLIKVYDQRVADYTTLDGKDEYEHPSADAANGLSGTETVTWRLRKN
jgi:hypothetical protein